MDKELQKPFLIALMALAIMQLIAIFDMPYGYYTLLRIVTCFFGAISAWIYFNLNNKLSASILSVIALIYNPIIPIYLDRDIWLILNILSSITFFITAYLFKSAFKK